MQATTKTRHARRLLRDQRGVSAPPATIQHYEKVEAECRVLLGSTRFASVEALIAALTTELGTRKIKEYEFTDLYFRPESEEGAKLIARGKTVRARRWTKYAMENGIRKEQSVQIVSATSETVMHEGVPFKVGVKTVLGNHATIEDATRALAGKGLAPWFSIAKSNGVHYHVLADPEVDCRFACEGVTVSAESRRWSSTMVEIEVISDDKAKAVAIYKKVLGALGVSESDVIGEPMFVFALNKLGISQG